MELTSLLIGLIARAACGGEPPRLDRSPSEDELLSLYRYAKAQDLAHLLCAPLDELGLLSPDSELQRQAERQAFLAVYRGERLGYELAAISDSLSRAEIAHIPLKGAVVRDLYPEPWMRTSADVDVLVRAEDAERAAEVLVRELGYRNDGVQAHDIQLVAASGLHLELHFETIEKSHLAPAHRTLSRIWDYAHPSASGSYRYALDGAMLLLYHHAHAAKHFRHAGVGIRAFLDLYLMRRRLEIDGERYAALLREANLTAFADASERLAEAWFSGAEHTETTARLARYVLNGGIYGSRDNSIAMQNARYGRLGSALRLVFLPYWQMKARYPSLARYRLAKLALPFYHLHRWCALVLRGRVRSSIRILQDNSRIGSELGGEVRLLMQELSLDR